MKTLAIVLATLGSIAAAANTANAQCPTHYEQRHCAACIKADGGKVAAAKFLVGLGQLLGRQSGQLGPRPPRPREGKTPRDRAARWSRPAAARAPRPARCRVATPPADSWRVWPPGNARAAAARRAS